MPTGRPRADPARSCTACARRARASGGGAPGAHRPDAPGPAGQGRRGYHAPVHALQFYSPAVTEQIKSRRKTVTIRLGDKSGKYEKGMIVSVLVGQRFGPRERVFDAVIDKVEVKPLGDVSPREIQHENPQLRTLDEFADFLRRLYNREVREDDLITVIHFSEIRA